MIYNLESKFWIIKIFDACYIYTFIKVNYLEITKNLETFKKILKNIENFKKIVIFGIARWYGAKRDFNFTTKNFHFYFSKRRHNM